MEDGATEAVPVAAPPTAGKGTGLAPPAATRAPEGREPPRAGAGGEGTDAGSAEKGKAEGKRGRSRKLIATFVGLLLAGLGNKIFIKLMMYPLYNYPLWVNVVSSFVYIPVSFSYILILLLRNRLSKAEREVPQLVFITMGALDALAGLLQMLATNFISSGSLLILLQQASIPLSMVMSRALLNTRYSSAQYWGAAVVVLGIVIILWPSFTSGGSPDGCTSIVCNQIVWSGVLVLSCLPMCLSTVYKERALAKVNLDPVYLNGFVSLYQFMISVPLSIPAAPLSGIAVADVPNNMQAGWLCYLGQDTVSESMATSLHPADNCWPMAPIFATLYLVINQVFNVLLVVMLQVGSANLLYLVLTLMLPLGNIAFSLPFMPNAQPLTVFNVAGLVVIMAGLFAYRFLDKIMGTRRSEVEEEEDDHADQARRAAVVLGSVPGSFSLESLQHMIDDKVLPSPTFKQLRRSPAQIRAGYFLKLGMRPGKGGSASASPLLARGDSYTPTLVGRQGSLGRAPPSETTIVVL